MPLDVYFRENIANVLRSVNMAGGGTAAIVNQEIEKAMRKEGQIDAADLAEHLGIYRQGYRDALGAVAAAFGILPSPTANIVPDMLAAHNAQDDVETQHMARSWRMKPKVSI